MSDHLSTRRSKRKSYIFRVDSEGSTDSKSYTFSGFKVRFFISFAVIVIVSVMASGIYLLGEIYLEKRTGRLVQENQFLQQQLTSMTERFETINHTVDSLGIEEEALRVKVNLTPLGEGVRKAGVGSILPLENDIIGDEQVEGLLRKLDQIEREIGLQVESFNEIEDKLQQDQEKLPHIPSIIPVQNARFTDGFGYRRDPFNGDLRFHHGADFSAPIGTPIYAAANGKVVSVKRVSGYGKLVTIDHGYGYKTRYGHLDDFKVRKGQRVNRGDMIGTVGNTGRSTAPHLHYEVILGDRKVDPLDYFYEGYYLAGQ